MQLKEGREKTIARLLALGYTNKQIADELFVAVVTVRKTLERIKKRNGIANRVRIAVEYAKEYKDV